MLTRPVVCVLPVALAPALLLACAAGCSNPQDPPGRVADSVPVAAPQLLPPTPVPAVSTGQSAPAAGPDPNEPGHGAKIASIAMRTWIYIAPSDRSTKLGYLRAGAVVDRAEASAGDKGCAGGWYRIVPRGYVCVGKGATLDIAHDVVLAAGRGPRRAGSTRVASAPAASAPAASAPADEDGSAPSVPYTYVLSRSPAPHLYFRLPMEADQARVEGPSYKTNAARYAHALDAIAADPVPAFLLAGADLPKPYGSEKKLHYSVHSGRAKEQSAFGLITAFEWTGRRFGLTTELDLIPLDRTRPARPSTLRGVVVDQPGIPAFVIRHNILRLKPDGKGGFHGDGPAPYRSGWVLTGKNNGSPHGILETTEGSWLPAEALRIAKPREDPAGFSRAGKKWIDISIKRQMLVAYEGTRPVYAALVSTGIGELGDPEKTHSTIRGTFMIHSKHVSGTMDGEEGSDDFDLRDVPYIQYFHEGFALHGAYWHDEFGKARSHGCVNLAPADAAWLFEWTDPVVPAEWHGAVNLEAGTLVWTHA